MGTTERERVVLVVTNGRDYSIKEVSEWIYHYGKKENVELAILDTSKQSLQVVKGAIGIDSDILFSITDTDRSFWLSSILGVFIRQARLRINAHTDMKSNSGSSTDIASRFGNYMMAYEATARYFILNRLSSANIIGYDSSGFINKLEVLKAAVDVGLDIPETELVSTKRQLVEFVSNHGEVILKSIGCGLNFVDMDEKISYLQLSKAIGSDDFDKIPDSFNLSMLQNRVHKEFEIRVFYLSGKCYSWCLLSQSKEETAVDYRNYNWDNPMRVVGFELPEDVSLRIIKLMKKLKLRTGSLDLIYSVDGKYVFLEVNPAGQYGYNSDSSNYYLDREIARTLLFENERTAHRTFHS